MLKILLVVLALAGCSMTTRNRATLIASTAGMMCDWGQTRNNAMDGWSKVNEGNMLLGPTPSVRSVDTYFASSILLNAVVWYVMPERWKAVIPGAVIGVQAVTITNNIYRDPEMRHCGL